MLIRLSIRDIVLIESCDIELKSGLCVLSGETGAGKSILLDSLGLVLGARADISLIRNQKEQGTVSAEFDISGNNRVKEILAELGLEESDNMIIRRIINSDGKSRALLNDQPIALTSLKKITENIIELNGQHDQKILMDNSLHKKMLDDYGKLAETQKSVAEKYTAWSKSKKAVSDLKEEIELATREQEYLRHMRSELKQLNPQIGEEESLSETRAEMMKSEKMFGVLDEAIAELNSGSGVLAALRNAQRTLSRSPLTNDLAEFSAIIEGLEKAAIEAEEALYSLEKIGQESQFDPVKLEETEERLFALKAAGRKYNLPLDELATLKEQVEEKLDIIDSQEEKLRKLNALSTKAKEEFLSEAFTLSDKRRKIATSLEKAVEKELKPLKMESTRFRVLIERTDEQSWNSSGIDNIQFECATNVPKDATEIHYASLNKIASGGEISRFMLALKVVLSGNNNTPTIIFDEIDTGTGGAVADAIGKRLAALSADSQILVVTHLPQVAVRGNHHLFISKQEKNGKIVTEVKELSTKEREEELARMLAGAIITKEARTAARKLLEQAA
ncbi:MAG: DNA repair protein RecN [Rickettsiales bacterium]